jgi:hypothetical protein
VQRVFAFQLDARVVLKMRLVTTVPVMLVTPVHVALAGGLVHSALQERRIP